MIILQNLKYTKQLILDKLNNKFHFFYILMHKMNGKKNNNDKNKMKKKKFKWKKEKKRETIRSLKFLTIKPLHRFF